MINITIIGTGYVGSVTGACLADFGNKVICIDNNQEKITSFQKGIVPFFEPGLDEIINRNIRSNRLVFSTDLVSAIKTSDVVFIAVGTPSLGDGSADLSFVKFVSQEIARYMEKHLIIVNKSTVPVGTGKKVILWVDEELKKNNRTFSFDVLSNPEFLREGSAVYDFMHPDRVVLGSESNKAISVLKDVYRPLYLNETPFIETNLETAEMIKYASNAFLATKITFINEIANLCEKTGANVQDVARAIGRDGRIGSKFLHPGPGYGGSCFPKDTRALAKIARDLNQPVTIIEAVISANEYQKKRQADKIESIMSGNNSLIGKTISILGLSFKTNTNDMREAPSLTICEQLIKKGANLRVYDPVSMDEAKIYLKEFKDSIYYAVDEYDTLIGSDALVIITEWNQFRTLDLLKVKENLKNSPYIFDLRNIYNREDIEAVGLKYYSTGR